MASSVVIATLVSFLVLSLCVESGWGEQEETVEGCKVKRFDPLVGDPFSTRCSSKSRSAYWTNRRGFHRKGAVLSVSNITKNYTGLYYCYDHLFKLEEVIRIEVISGNRYNATEGNIFVVKCKTSSRYAYWTNMRGFYERGPSLSFFPVKRALKGWYYCFRSHGDLVEKIYMDVFYPAKILHVVRKHSPINVNDTFCMEVMVEGHPDPMTSLIQQDGGKVVSKKAGPGKFKIKTEPVHCADGGMYRLTTQNQVGNETKAEELNVYCAPSPKSGLAKNLKPRLGQKTSLKVENVGYPYPTYTWTFKGKVVANGTGHNENEYDINDVHVEDFGKYTLTMENQYGSATLQYTVRADGPPEPVTDIVVSNITEHDAVISFVSGYDYNDYQSFKVESFNGKTYTETEIFEDEDEHEPHLVTHELHDLDLGTTYNISIISNNSRGDGKISQAFVIFTTEAPYTMFDVKEGGNLTLECNGTGYTAVHWELAPYTLYEVEEDGNLTLECNGTGYTDVHWELDNGTVVSEGEELDIVNVTRTDSGFYRCVGMTSSDLLHILEDYHVDVQYPARILNVSIEDDYFNVNETFVMAVEVEGHPTPEVTFTKMRHGEVVFSAEKEGDLDVMVDPIECTDLGMYELNVKNKLGTETYEQYIYVYCPPVVDPQAVIKKKVYPRLGNKEALKILSYGYPYPKYSWKHGDNPIDKHQDSDYESVVDLDVTVENFGNYFVDMENKYGQADYSFEVIASGPPDPITDFKLANKTDDTVTLSWVSGYNYGSPQTFVVMATKEVPDKLLTATQTTNFTFNDTSKHGQEPGYYVLTGLESATNYNFTVVSLNMNGTSALPKADVHTETNDAPTPSAQTGDNKEKNAIIGGVIGAVCFVGILAIVAVFLKKRHARRTTYEQIAG